MSYAIQKQTYADGQAYRYHISDKTGRLRYVAEPTGYLLPSPTRLVEFFDPDHNRVGRIQPPDSAPWRRAERYEVFTGGETEKPRAIILERWRLVDILLLRLPRYVMQLGKYNYVVRGSRYGGRFYQIFRPRRREEVEAEDEPEERIDAESNRSHTEESEEEPQASEVEVGQIERPVAGPSYLVETEAAPLRQAPMVLAALVILIDMELYS
jgi:hypothetical protein